MDAIKIISQNVGQTVSLILERAGKEKLKTAKEIRLSVNKPIRIVYPDGSKFIGRDGRICNANSYADSLSRQDIKDAFAALCKYSVHTYQKNICEGFITIEGGIRVGICGTAIYDGGKIVNIKDISSLNIRIVCEIKGAADSIFKKTGRICGKGILIAGPPCSGKTTLLRDIARTVGNEGKNVCIVDERMEIAGVFQGAPSFDIGECTAVLNGFYKSDGIIIGVRSMAPDVIICDEFGGENEIEASLYAMKGGTAVIASMHCLDLEDLRSKTEFKTLAEKGVFEWVILTKRSCEIESIMRVGEILK